VVRVTTRTTPFPRTRSAANRGGYKLYITSSPAIPSQARLRRSPVLLVAAAVMAAAPAHTRTPPQEVKTPPSPSLPPDFFPLFPTQPKGPNERIHIPHRTPSFTVPRSETNSHHMNRMLLDEFVLSSHWRRLVRLHVLWNLAGQGNPPAPFRGAEAGGTEIPLVPPDENVSRFSVHSNSCRSESHVPLIRLKVPLSADSSRIHMICFIIRMGQRRYRSPP
jgi:hypothetical protein